MLKQLLCTQPIGDARAPRAVGHELERALSATTLTVLGIGGIVGTGIFVLTGTAAADHAGPALMLSFVVAGIGCAFAALCYAEFSAMIPVSGSAYSYCYATLGEAVAWFVGWNLLLEYLFAIATVSTGWSGYVLSLLAQFRVHVPYALSHAPFDQAAGPLEIVRTGAILNIPAVAIAAAVAVVCYIGIRQTAALNAVIVAVKVAVIVAFVVFGASHIRTPNWHPFVPPNTGAFGRFGWSGVLGAAGVIFFAYIGFDAISTAAQETHRPQRAMPIAILASLAICTLLYVAVSAVLTGMVRYERLSVPDPVAFAIDQHPSLAWLGVPVKIGAIAGMTSVILVMTLAQARIFLSMAHDGLIPEWFARIHPRYRTPSAATVVTGSTAAIIGGLLPVRILGELVSIGTLAAFITVCLGVLVLRRTRPDLHRPFRAPAPWFTCIAGAAVCAAMMVSLGPSTWIRLVGWTLVGTAVYAGYGYRHSRLHAAVACTTGAASSRRTADGADRPRGD